MKINRAVFAMVFLLSGCSSCNRGEEPSTAAGGGAAKPAQPAPATPSKIQVAPPQATTVRQANPAAPQAEGGAPPAAAPQGTQQPGEGEAAHDDCAVVVDVNPDFGPPPLSVTFTAEAECGQGATYKWDFGDGSPPSTEANPSHTYTKDGDYTATVTVSGPNGATASDDIDIFVEEE